MQLTQGDNYRMYSGFLAPSHAEGQEAASAQPFCSRHLSCFKRRAPDDTVRASRKSDRARLNSKHCRPVFPSSRKMGNFRVPPSTKQEKGGMIPRGTLIRASRFYG